MTDLLPCPFCGGAAVDRRQIDGFPMIYCDGADCFGPQTTAKNFDDAITQWNRRAHLPAVPQEAPHKALLEEILKIAETEEIPDRHGKWRSACSTTCLNEIATVVSSALSRPERS